jgi:transposase
LKEDFRAWFNAPHDRATAATALDRWLARVAASGLKALQSFTKMMGNWRERILNYFDGRHSNGFAEGVNLKIKLINRRAFGSRTLKISGCMCSSPLSLFYIKVGRARKLNVSVNLECPIYGR